MLTTRMFQTRRQCVRIPPYARPSAADRTFSEGSSVTRHWFQSLILNYIKVIERQLVHGERNLVRAAYSHAQYLPERRQMHDASRAVSAGPGRSFVLSDS